MDDNIEINYLNISLGFEFPFEHKWVWWSGNVQPFK